MDTIQNVSVNKPEQTSENLTNGPPSLGPRQITYNLKNLDNHTLTNKITDGLKLKPGSLSLQRRVSSIGDEIDCGIVFPGPFSFNNPEGISFPGTKAPERKRLITEAGTSPPPPSEGLTRQVSIYPKYDPRSRTQRGGNSLSNIIDLDNDEGYVSSSEEDIIHQTENTNKPSRSSTLDFVPFLSEQEQKKLFAEIIDRATNNNTMEELKHPFTENKSGKILPTINDDCFGSSEDDSEDKKLPKHPPELF